MKHIASARFAITNWDEKPYSEGQDLPKLTRAAVTKTYTGDIAGEGHVEYLMMYANDGSATFVGLERVAGSLAGRRAASCSNAPASSRTVGEGRHTVVAGSGTGEGLRGDGASAVGHGMEHPLTLHYELG
jgi:hypothetical protein